MAAGAAVVLDARGILWRDGWEHFTRALHQRMAVRALQTLVYNR
jgi:hypothetical protein